MRKLSHNKKRNLSLVYEFLTREVTVATVEGDPHRAAESLSIISKYFSEGKVLHEELSLQRQVVETRGASPALARRIVDELKSAGIRLSATAAARNRAKSDLIHEMNRRLGRDIFDRYRIPDYTTHASANIILSRGLGARIDESIEVTKVEEHLVECLMSKGAPKTSYDPDATMFAYNKAIKFFQEEFGTELNAEQSALLREYVRVSLGGNPAPFKRMFEKHRVVLQDSLSAHRADPVFQQDKEMAKKLDEAIAELRTIEPSTEGDQVERLMLFHNLRKEIAS